MKSKVMLVILAMFMALVAFAQIPVGTWRSHASYGDITALEETPNRIFAVGDNHLFSISKSDRSVNTYTKCDNMSDNNVACVKYDTGTGNLLIAYTNANIDVVDEDGNVYNIPDIYQKNLTVDKGINDIFFLKGYAYLSTNFGIVVVNLKKMEIKDTYVIGDDANMDPVYSVTSDGKYLYALMGTEVKRAPLSGKNLLDYNNWKSDEFSLPIRGLIYDKICYFKGCFVLSATKGDIYKLDGETWSLLTENIYSNDVILRATDKYLVTGIAEKVMFVYDADWNLLHQKQLPGVDYLFSNDVFYTANNDYGVLVYVDDETPVEYITCSGPATTYSQSIRYDNGYITVAPGFSWKNRGLRAGGLYFFKDDKWTSYTGRTTGAADITPDGFFNDIVSIAIDPANVNHVFASTWGEGVYEFLDGKAVALHTVASTNNALKPVASLASNPTHYTRVDGLMFDSEGKLWATSSCIASQGSMNCVAYMTPEGVWKEASGYSPLEMCATMQQMMFHSNGQQWFRSARHNPGVFIKGSNKSRFFSSFTDKYENTITTAGVYSMAEDLSGNVWVGTDQGPIIFTNTSKVFDSTYRVNRIKIAREDGSGLADFLLNGISVTALAVDGGNRIWIGTDQSGVYLISNDGQTMYHHFTVDNSPLPSNDISAIAIQPETGEVFIGTADGIVSYRDGTIPAQKKLSDANIHVFPNPVNPDYKGLITVVGLESGTVVRVVDASGKLVHEGSSFGGSMSWDGKDLHGDYVAGGVYFFHLFNTDEDNSRSACAKVLIIR